jgi:hypothetical protein
MKTPATEHRISATNIATGETYYLAGFETVRLGYVRATFTQLPAQAKRYSSKTSARAVTKWSNDPYCSTRFTNFAAVSVD